MKASPQRTAFFDDIPRNLVPAHALGCTTVWVRNDLLWSKEGPAVPEFRPEQIDHETADLRGFLEEIRVGE
jgi:putative hydrolase of the HAD superfamily